MEEPLSPIGLLLHEAALYFERQAQLSDISRSSQRATGVLLDLVQPVTHRVRMAEQ